MLIFELDKNEEEYAERICELAETAIIIENPKSFCSNLSEVIQIGVTLAPYAISGVVLIIIELIKNKKKIKIRVTDTEIEVEGAQEKALEVAKELIELQQTEKAKKVLSDLLSGK